MDSLHHSLIARAASLVRIFVAKKKKLFKSCPGLVQARLCFRRRQAARPGEPLRPHELASLSRSEAQEALEGRLREAWQVARSGTLPPMH